jgi:hypothetical protein
LKYLTASGKRKDNNLVFIEAEGSCEQKDPGSELKEFGVQEQALWAYLQRNAPHHATIMLSEGWYPSVKEAGAFQHRYYFKGIWLCHTQAAKEAS